MRLFYSFIQTALLCLLVKVTTGTSGRLFCKNLNLEPSLLNFSLTSDEFMRKRCYPASVGIDSTSTCWGYEENCTLEKSYSSNIIRCTEKSQKDVFWKQADFALLKYQRESLKGICKSENPSGSALTCSDHLRYCRGRNIFVDLKNLHSRNSKRYRNDVILEGQVGGRCDELDEKLLLNRSDELSYLQSWGHELKNFKSVPLFDVDEKNCDVIFERPTYIIKLDASVNMYHHFCDFVNLFATQILNGSLSPEVDILWWDTHSEGYVDETFGIVWKAFSSYPPVELISLDKKKVCFRDAVFSLLARQRRGLYYNMPLVSGCSGSGLFDAFTRHLAYRLNISQHGPLLNKIRITFLTRVTPYRQILNSDELNLALNKLSNVVVSTVNFDEGVSFNDQLQIIRNSDILIGIHGSGLTHLLFLPDWAVLFELYNCGDTNCYKDLARLRGVNYLTWSKSMKLFPDGPGRHPQSGQPHEKFANYAFDVEEFIYMTKKAMDLVKRHSSYVAEQRTLRRMIKSEL